MNFTSLKNIDGVVTRANFDYTKRKLINDLDTLPFMARDTLDERIKNLSQDMISKFELRIFCGRGCFGKCSFCANIATGKMCKGSLYRQRSIENLYAEMKSLYEKYGVTRFSFWDDNFIPKGTNGYNKVIAISQMIKKLPFEPVFGIQTRVDTISDSIIKILQNAGMQNIYLGVENIDVNELNVLGKKISPTQIKKALSVLYDFGYSYSSESKYRLHIGYIAFTPYSTIESVRKNIDFIKEYNIPIKKIGKKLLAFHGTDIREKILNDGLLTNEFQWNFINLGVKQLYESIKRILNVYSTFYNDVRYIGKIAKFGDINLNWNEISEIKQHLHLIALNGIQEVCYAARDNDIETPWLEKLADSYTLNLKNLDKSYHIKEQYNDFVKKNESIIKLFDNVSYVFFD